MGSYTSTSKEISAVLPADFDRKDPKDPEDPPLNDVNLDLWEVVNALKRKGFTRLTNRFGVSMDLEEACDMVLPLLQSPNRNPASDEETMAFDAACETNYGRMKRRLDEQESIIEALKEENRVLGKRVGSLEAAVKDAMRRESAASSQMSIERKAKEDLRAMHQVKDLELLRKIKRFNTSLEVDLMPWSVKNRSPSDGSLNSMTTPRLVLSPLGTAAAAAAAAAAPPFVTPARAPSASMAARKKARADLNDRTSGTELTRKTNKDRVQKTDARNSSENVEKGSRNGSSFLVQDPENRSRIVGFRNGSENGPRTGSQIGSRDAENQSKIGGSDKAKNSSRKDCENAKNLARNGTDKSSEKNQKLSQNGIENAKTGSRTSSQNTADMSRNGSCNAVNLRRNGSENIENLPVLCNPDHLTRSGSEDARSLSRNSLQHAHAGSRNSSENSENLSLNVPATAGTVSQNRSSHDGSRSASRNDFIARGTELELVEAHSSLQLLPLNWCSSEFNLEEELARTLCSKAKDCSVTVKDCPANVKDCPANVKDCPTNVKDCPSNVKDCPSNGKDCPSNVKDCPSNVKDCPSNVKDCPSNVKDCPSNVRYWPFNVKDCPANVKDCPANVKDCPSNVKDCLSNVKDCPSNVKDCPSKVKDCPSKVKNCPSNVKDCPSKTSDSSTKATADNQRKINSKGTYTPVTVTDSPLKVTHGQTKVKSCYLKNEKNPSKMKANPEFQSDIASSSAGIRPLDVPTSPRTWDARGREESPKVGRPDFSQRRNTSPGEQSSPRNDVRSFVVANRQMASCSQSPGVGSSKATPSSNATPSSKATLSSQTTPSSKTTPSSLTTPSSETTPSSQTTPFSETRYVSQATYRCEAPSYMVTRFPETTPSSQATPSFEITLVSEITPISEVKSSSENPHTSETTPIFQTTPSSATPSTATPFTATPSSATPSKPMPSSNNTPSCETTPSRGNVSKWDTSDTYLTEGNGPPPRQPVSCLGLSPGRVGKRVTISNKTEVTGETSSSRVSPSSRKPTRPAITRAPTTVTGTPKSVGGLANSPTKDTPHRKDFGLYSNLPKSAIRWADRPGGTSPVQRTPKRPQSPAKSQREVPASPSLSYTKQHSRDGNRDDDNVSPRPNEDDDTTEVLDVPASKADPSSFSEVPCQVSGERPGEVNPPELVVLSPQSKRKHLQPGTTERNAKQTQLRKDGVTISPRRTSAKNATQLDPKMLDRSTPPKNYVKPRLVT